MLEEDKSPKKESCNNNELDAQINNELQQLKQLEIEFDRRIRKLEGGDIKFTPEFIKQLAKGYGSMPSCYIGEMKKQGVPQEVILKLIDIRQRNQLVHEKQENSSKWFWIIVGVIFWSLVFIFWDAIDKVANYLLDMPWWFWPIFIILFALLVVPLGMFFAMMNIGVPMFIFEKITTTFAKLKKKIEFRKRKE